MTKLTGLISEKKIDTNFEYISKTTKETVTKLLEEETIKINAPVYDEDFNPVYFPCDACTHSKICKMLNSDDGKNTLTDAILISLNVSKFFYKETLTLSYIDYNDINDIRNENKKFFKILSDKFDFTHNRKKNDIESFGINNLGACLFIIFCSHKWINSIQLIKYNLDRHTNPELEKEGNRKHYVDNDFHDAYDSFVNLYNDLKELSPKPGNVDIFADLVWIEATLKINYVNKVINYIYENDLNLVASKLFIDFAASFARINNPLVRDFLFDVICKNLILTNDINQSKKDLNENKQNKYYHVPTTTLKLYNNLSIKTETAIRNDEIVDCIRANYAEKFPRKIKNFITLWNFNYDKIWYESHDHVCKKYVDENNKLIMNNKILTEILEEFISRSSEYSYKLLQPPNMNGHNKTKQFINIIELFLQNMIFTCCKTPNAYITIKSTESTDKNKEDAVYLESAYNEFKDKFSQSFVNQSYTNGTAQEQLIKISSNLVTETIDIIKQFYVKKYSIDDLELQKDIDDKKILIYRKLFDFRSVFIDKAFKNVSNIEEEREIAFKYMYGKFYERLENVCHDFVKLLYDEIILGKDIVLNYKESNFYKNMDRDYLIPFNDVIKKTHTSYYSQNNVKQNVINIKSINIDYYNCLQEYKLSSKMFSETSFNELDSFTKYMKKNYSNINEYINSLTNRGYELIKSLDSNTCSNEEYKMKILDKYFDTKSCYFNMTDFQKGFIDLLVDFIDVLKPIPPSVEIYPSDYHKKLMKKTMSLYDVCHFFTFKFDV